jgi:hypothetical protein
MAHSLGIPGKRMVHSLGRRVERNMRIWLELLLELLNCINCIFEHCDVNLHICISSIECTEDDTQL